LYLVLYKAVKLVAAIRSEHRLELLALYELLVLILVLLHSLVLEDVDLLEQVVVIRAN